MKKLIFTLCAFLAGTNAFAYYDDYGYPTHSDEMSGFAIFTLILMIVYIILSIIFLVRWWNMTGNVKEIKDHLMNTNSNPKLTYLIAIGEKEKANKAALVMLVDRLMPIYYDSYDLDKVDTMNEIIKSLFPKIEKLGIILPDYVKSGENFIDYLNNLTGNKVPYHESDSSNNS